MTYDQFYAMITLFLCYIGWAGINVVFYIVILICERIEVLNILFVKGMLFLLKWSWRLYVLVGVTISSCIVWFLISTRDTYVR